MNFQRYKGLIMLLISILLIIVAYSLIHWLNFFTKHDSEEVHFSIFIATVALVLIAYYEFEKSHKLTTNEFLLFISNRWNSKAIIKARQILHNIFIDAYRDESGRTKSEYGVALSKISEKILQMSRKKDKEGENFIYLLNLLDYLETLSYFYNQKFLRLKDVQNTCGNNIIFFYESFRLYAEQRRSHDKKYFLYFTALYYKLKKSDLTQPK